MTFFSNRENYNNKGQMTELIPINVWNGIAICVNTLIHNNNLAKDYPSKCPDGNGICGVDEKSFYVSAKSLIPTIEFLPQYGGDIEPLSNNYLDPNPFEQTEEVGKKRKQFMYNVLDFVEFVFAHICDVQNGKYHEFYHHYELIFVNTTKAKEKFVNDVNEIFSRNNIAFKLCDNGQIQRILNEQLNNLINTVNEPKEKILNDLLKLATEKIKSPKIEERRIALEKLWDAYERIKTVINPNNKQCSSNELIEKVSKGNVSMKEVLIEECKMLNKIGNEYFQIRHSEMNKTPIDEVEHIDYLFFRMYSIINLLLNNIE